MDNECKKKRQANPRKYANIFSKLTFWYTFTLFKKGFKRELEEEDLYEILPEFESSSLADRIELEWEKQKHRRNPLFWVFWKMFGIRYCRLSLLVISNITFSITRPILISKLVSLFAPGQKEFNKMKIYLFSLLLITLRLIDVLCSNTFHYYAESMVIELRTAICTLIYRKLLRLPASQLRHASFGKITNLITRDISGFDQSFAVLIYGLIGLIIGTVTCYNMYQSIGFPALIASFALVLAISFQVLMGVWLASLKEVVCNRTDKRISLLQDVLSNIRSIKMYVWEQIVEKGINISRQKESNIFLKLVIVLFSSVVIGITIGNVSFYLVLLTFTWFDRQLSSEIIYFITGTLMSISFALSITFPYAILASSQVTAATRRMQKLVLEMKIERKDVIYIATDQPKIELKKITVTAEDKLLIRDATFQIKSGLTLVTGGPSSGKSILLMTILKEFDIREGSLLVEGRISYAQQEPWLFPSTIRQNIIFGSEYNHERYQRVINACDLQYDFDQLRNGDLTIVADRGINLSKGQQSRINLARAIYKESDIYLLDDCLSSLDSLVQRSIFVNCIQKFLKSKLVMLVSHNQNFVPYAANILKLNDGNLQKWTNGCPEEIQNLGSTIIHNGTYFSENFENEDNVDPEKKKLICSNKRNKIYGENKKAGAVSSKVYQTYVRLGGGAFLFLIIFCVFVINQLLLSYKDKLISNWANLEDQIVQLKKINGSSSEYIYLTETRKDIIFKHTIAVVSLTITTLIRAWLLFICAKRVSIHLHTKMLQSVLNAPQKFFDKTFIGNIINRFSKDLVAVDENIPFPLHHLTAIIFETIGNLVIIASTNIKLMVPISFLFISFCFLRYVYLRTGRALKRLDVSTKSPVIGYLNATLEGLVSIRAFGAEKLLKQEFEKHHNLYNSASFSYFVSLRAFVYFADMFATIFLVMVVSQFAIFDEDVLPGDFGLAVSQAFVIAFVMQYGTHKMCELETQMTSVERAMEYTTIDRELKTGLELDEWPNKAEIKFENVHLFVDNEKSCILKNINFILKPQQKLGIVGRTGAGKSSIISALLRIYEIKGKISIDDTDISTLSLSFLRSRIAIVPQDPVLIDGTIRKNIDPLQLYQDEQIWSALESTKLKNLVSDLNVDMKELELSYGQKQLLCLARVLVAKKKILVLDEMVEAVDSETENLIYDIVKRDFALSTVIKISHKLKFIMDCDEILVLENGELVEYDSPENLLQNVDGLFYKMVEGAI